MLSLTRRWGFAAYGSVEVGMHEVLVKKNPVKTNFMVAEKTEKSGAYLQSCLPLTM